MELVNVVAHEVLTALYDVAGAFVLVGAMAAAKWFAVYRATR